ncbi:MAG: ABC transporter ATP-binding protein [Thermodesulfobacteriota bacterium]
MNSPIIKVENLGKKYRIEGRFDRYSTIRETLKEAFLTPVRRLRALAQGHGVSDAPETFWALQNVSFEVQPGEVVGIIGRNGAGKTTLLKILSRVTTPTTGRVVLAGRVGSLLEVGVGFHPELSGRDNIYLSGAIMGMKRVEIARKYDEIAAFSGVADFLNTPVKRYSSGMYTRLAFAVAAHLEPEILIVDEVLAVGDLGFQNKCLGKMSEVARSGRTVLFVSHNLSAIATLCTRGLLLEKGEIIFQGNSSEVISQYVKLTRSMEPQDLSHRLDRKGTGALRVTRFYLEDEEGGVLEAAQSGGCVRFVLEYEGAAGTPLREVAGHIMVADGSRYRIFSFLSEIVGEPFSSLPPSGRLICRVPDLPLLPGNYDLHFSCLVGRQLADKMHFAASLVVAEGDFFGTGRLFTDRDAYGNVLVHHSWTVDTASRTF